MLKTRVSNTTKRKFNNGDYDTAYAEFIMERAPGDRVICNGDSLILAMEAGYMQDEFLDYLENIE